MRFVIIFVISCALLFLLLWLYPAHIFEAVVTGHGSEISVELSLKAIFLGENFPEAINAANVESVKPTFAGYFMMVICLLGLPVLIAWRFNMKRAEETDEQQ
jgi:hypothetical protein